MRWCLWVARDLLTAPIERLVDQWSPSTKVLSEGSVFWQREVQLVWAHICMCLASRVLFFGHALPCGLSRIQTQAATPPNAQKVTENRDLKRERSLTVSGEAEELVFLCLVTCSVTAWRYRDSCLAGMWAQLSWARTVKLSSQAPSGDSASLRPLLGRRLCFDFCPCWDGTSAGPSVVLACLAFLLPALTVVPGTFSSSFQSLENQGRTQECWAFFCSCYKFLAYVFSHEDFLM